MSRNIVNAEKRQQEEVGRRKLASKIESQQSLELGSQRNDSFYGGGRKIEGKRYREAEIVQILILGLCLKESESKTKNLGAGVHSQGAKKTKHSNKGQKKQRHYTVVVLLYSRSTKLT